LNGQRFHALKYSGPGTDLTIGLADGHEWEGGASTARNGITCNANIPTEEVFTTPHCRRVSGHVVSSKPLSYQGTLIDNIAVRFEEGRIVEAKASRGEEELKKVLQTDEGAARLGEVALVPHSSPISKSGLLFFNTLFDENAASHIALGQCYSTCFVDGGKLTPQQIAAPGGNAGIAGRRAQRAPERGEVIDRVLIVAACQRVATPLLVRDLLVVHGLAEHPPEGRDDLPQRNRGADQPIDGAGRQ